MPSRAWWPTRRQMALSCSIPKRLPGGSLPAQRRLLHVIVGKAAQSANQTIYIDNDNALAGEEATDYLCEMGHRRIAYFGVSNAMLFSAERRRGYQMSLLKHGITPGRRTVWRSIP